MTEAQNEGLWAICKHIAETPAEGRQLNSITMGRRIVVHARGVFVGGGWKGDLEGIVSSVCVGHCFVGLRSVHNLVNIINPFTPADAKEGMVSSVYVGHNLDNNICPETKPYSKGPHDFATLGEPQLPSCIYPPRTVSPTLLPCPSII